MIDAVQIELERLGFSVVEHGTKRLNNLYDASNERARSHYNGAINALIISYPKNGQRVSFEKVI